MFRSLGVFPHRFEQQASIALLYQETQLPECGVVRRAAPLQAGDQLLVQQVVLQEVPDGEDGPLADNFKQSVKENMRIVVSLFSFSFNYVKLVKIKK